MHDMQNSVRTTTKNSTIAVEWKIFGPLVRSSAGKIFVGMVALVSSTIFVVWASVILGRICALLGSSGVELSNTWVLMAQFVSLEILSIMAQFLSRHYLAMGTNKVLRDLRVALFGKLNELPMGYFDVQPLGRIITRLTNDVEGMEGFFSGGLARITTACVQIVLVLIGIVFISPGYGALVVASAIPSLGFSWLTRKPVRYWLGENKIRNAHVNSTLAEFIQGLPVLRVLGLEKWSAQQFAADNKRFLESSFKVLSWNSFIRPVTVFLSMIPTLIAVIAGAWFLMHGRVELAAIVAVVRLTERFSSPVRVVTQEIQVIQDAAASANRVAEMLAERGEENPSAISTPKHGAVIEGNIVFNHVLLSYKPSRDILTDFDLHVPAGQKLGIVGATGAGKSSVINLIPGLYRPRAGQVLVDGVEVGNWDLSSLRKQIGYLAQEPFLAKGSLGENLLGPGWKDDHALRNKFLEAVQACGLSAVLERFPGGFDYEVREGGSNLSSGEKQMIAFMRLIHEDRPILLMDEATSCLDKTWESAIQRAVLVLMSQRKRTCVIIAHRLETLRSCDRVIRMRAGTIVADGLPNEVLSKDSLT